MTLPNYEVRFDEESGEFIKTGAYYDEVFPQEETAYNEENPNSDFDADDSAWGDLDYFEVRSDSNADPFSDIIKAGLEHFEQSPLYDIAVNELHGKIVAWAYEDFDNDGEKEAFVRLEEDSDEDSETEGSIWFISRSYTSRLIPYGGYCFLLEDSVLKMRDTDMQIIKFVKIYGRHGFSEIYTVKNGIPMVVNVDGAYYDIRKDENSDLIIGVNYLWSEYNNEWNEYGNERLWYGDILLFDSNSMTLTSSGHVVSLDNTDAAWLEGD